MNNFTKSMLIAGLTHYQAAEFLGIQKRAVERYISGVNDGSWAIPELLDLARRAHECVHVANFEPEPEERPAYEIARLRQVVFTSTGVPEAFGTQSVGTEYESLCNRDGCGGIIDFELDGDCCSCHIAAPCGAHENATLYCPECYWAEGEDA